MHKLPNLLKSRHGIYYLRTWSAGKERRLSLRTKDWSVAKLQVLRYHLELAMTNRKLDVIFPSGLEVKNINTEADFDRFKELMESGRLDEAMKTSARTIEEVRSHLGMAPSAEVMKPPSSPTAPAKTKPFSVATELYLAEKKLDNKPKTLDEKRGTFAEFSRLFGDLDTNSINSEQAISFKSRMISDGLNANRINKKLSFMKDFFGYCVSHKLYFSGNPFDGLSISNKTKLKAAVRSYEEFTDDELNLIFGNADYRKLMNEDDYYWIPFLGLFTGARLESLASLTVDQVKKDGDIWFLDITSDKNANSIRKVPLHERVIEAGFTDYVEQIRTNGHSQVFPHLKPGKNGFSRNCSRRFGQYLDSLGIKDSRKVFHSFRATFINRMTNVGTHPHVLMGLVGHFEQNKIDFSSPHFQNYQKTKPLRVLKDALDKLHYEISFSVH